MSGSLSHTVSQVIRQLLIDNGLGSDGGASWPVYSMQGADTPDDTILVIDRAGIARGRFQTSGEVQEVHGIEILVRSKDGQKGWKKAQDIKVDLTQNSHLATVTVTDPEGYGTATQDYTIFNISHRSGPLPIPDSNSDRKIHTINFVVTIREN